MIDKNIQQELRNKYNPDGSQLRKHQMRMLEMLKYFDEFCQKHNINYWLSSGNCIGVVRHGGFIPWDDDIDVEMLREDFLKLEKAFHETHDYALQTWKNDKYYLLPFAKLRDKHSCIIENINEPDYKYKGIYIDVFILERTPAKISLLLYYIYRCVRFLYKKDDWFRERLFLLFKYLFFALISIARFFTVWWPKNKLRHTFGVGWWLYFTRDLTKIFPLQRGNFDGVQVNLPKNLDEYLKTIYGDYMMLPSEDKIRKPHVIKCEIYNI